MFEMEGDGGRTRVGLALGSRANTCGGGQVRFLYVMDDGASRDWNIEIPMALRQIVDQTFMEGNMI